MQARGMYTVFTVNGAYFVDVKNATRVFDALSDGRSGDVSFTTAACAVGATRVTLNLDDVIALIAHDTDTNADLRAWRGRRAQRVISLAEYVARKGRLAAALG